MNLSIFKAYDVRGRYPSEIDEAAVFKIAQALARFFNRQKQGNNSLVVAYDARLSSPALFRALLKGLAFDKKGKKLKLINAGMATTPALYFLVNRYKTKGGVMITASHNPKGYNGLKVVKAGSDSMSGFEVLEILKSEEDGK